MTAFPKAKREDVQALIGIAGPSSSGKTLSALRVATGLAGGKPFVFVDTENGRALHYADDFDFYHANLDEPFSPAHYREVIAQAAADKPPVIVIDSMSHEHTGVGGVLSMHEAELDRRAGDDFKKREALNMSAWIKPKAERKLLIADLLRLRCHVILCFRAEEKVDIVPDPQKPGKTKIVPKRTLAGHVGWIPVCGKEYPYELTMSLVVTPDQPGFPKPIKIMDQHRPMVPLDQPLSEQVGRRLAEWAAGSESASGAKAAPTLSGASGEGNEPGSEADTLAAIEQRLLEHAELTGNEAIGPSIEKARAEKSEAQFAVWLRTQGRKLDEKLAGVS